MHFSFLRAHSWNAATIEGDLISIYLGWQSGFSVARGQAGRSENLGPRRLSQMPAEANAVGPGLAEELVSSRLLADDPFEAKCGTPNPFQTQIHSSGHPDLKRA
jgi:hypothetical protein